MSEFTPLNQEETEKLEARAKKLAQEKSYLQLLINMMQQLSAVSGLDNVANSMLNIILNNLGGTNIILYYFIDDETFYLDVYGKKGIISRNNDEEVKQIIGTQSALVVEHDFADTLMQTPEFSKAWTWVYPLKVGSSLIGVVKLENLHIGTTEWREQLPTFFSFAALTLKNEILGYTRLQKAYDELEQEVFARQQAEEELRVINDQLLEAKEDLEVRVEERTAELRGLNQQLNEELSERIRIEGVLRQSELTYRMLIELSPLPISIVDSSLNILSINKKFTDTFGYTLEDMPNAEAWFKLAYPDEGYRKQVINEFQGFMELLKKGELLTSQEATVVCKKAEKKVILFSYGMVGTNMMVYYYDVTEIRKAKQQLQDINLNLEKRVKEEVAKSHEKDMLLIQQSRMATMGELLHNVAHQWRQPLTALTLILYNIKTDFEFGELTQESLDEMVKSANEVAQRMSATIDEFRSFFKPDYQKIGFSLKEAIEESVKLIKPSLNNNQIDIEVGSKCSILVRGFPKEFSQVMLNILVNSEDAINNKGGGGKIAIECSKEEKFAVVTIQDSGGGIPVDVLPKVFEPYFTTKIGSGTGIGLYMCRMIIEHMHGTVEVLNTNGGALVTIRVPMDKG